MDGRGSTHSGVQWIPLWSLCRASSTVRPGTSRGSMPGHPEQFVDVVKGRVGEVVTEPRPPQSRTCGHYRIRFLASEFRSWMMIHDPQVRKCPKSDASSPARLSTFVSLSRYEAQSLLVFPSSGSAHATPPFPRSGPGGPGSPLSSVLCGRYDPLTCVPSAYLFANRYRGALPGVCAFARALPPSGQRRTVGRGLLFSAGIPFPAVYLPRTRQGLPSSLASHPVALRRSSDPGRPLAPRP